MRGKMPDVVQIGQGHHAALMLWAAVAPGLQHFPPMGWQMLQEIRAASVDLGENRP
jgi:hypothetical protein